MNYKTISIQIVDKVCILTLNRPEKLNILSRIFFDEFDHAINNISQNKNLRVLIIAGNEKVFSAGGDLNEIGNADRETAKVMCMGVQKVFASLFALDIPVIAAVSGIVYGGGLELALHCDIRFCSEETIFKLPESDLGLIPGAGGISLFSKIFSKADAAYYLMSGIEIPVETAMSKGLVQNVFETEKLLDETISFAKELSKKSRASLSAIKKILIAGYFETTEECLNMEIEEFVSTLNIDGKDKIREFFKFKVNKNK